MSLSHDVAVGAIHGANHLPENPSALELPDWRPESVIGQLFREPGGFDFFQAVTLLEQLQSRHFPVGRAALPTQEGLRFRTALGSAFPASAVTEVLPPGIDTPQAEMTVALFGLTGPSGILPRHYTELIYRLDREAKGPQRNALRDWFDLFNHRLISLYHRSWEKYRPQRALSRGEHQRPQADTFTTAAFSLAGLGFEAMRNQLQVTAQVGDPLSSRQEQLTHVNDLALLRYSGLLAQRPRTAGNLTQLLRDYFSLPISVDQFQGQWLSLDQPQQSSLSWEDTNNVLGLTAVAGEKVWDIQSKLRIHVGPLTQAQFLELMPEESPSPRQKTFFLLCHLTRLYIGPELEFDVQLELQADEVPHCEMTSEPQRGPRLGWNTWLLGEPASQNALDACFEAAELHTIDGREHGLGRL
jgi:type VI secretion system protein ImpH